MTEPGRPEHGEEQYKKWLEIMEPFLKAGNTIWYAMSKCDLLTFKDSIYKKYRSNDWFSEKINVLRSMPGELVNEFFYREVLRIVEKQRNNLALTREDYDIMKHFSEKHRSAQPFFVTRNETAQVAREDIGVILDRLEEENNTNLKTDYAELGRKAGEQLENIQNGNS